MVALGEDVNEKNGQEVVIGYLWDLNLFKIYYEKQCDVVKINIVIDLVTAEYST